MKHLSYFITCITISTLSLCANAITIRSAFTPISADSATTQSSATVWTSGTGGVGGLSTTSWVEYDGIDFGATGANQFQASVALSGTATLMIHADSLTGPKIATLPLLTTGSWSVYKAQSGPATPLSGVHNIFLTVSAGVNIASFQFMATPAPKPSPSPSPTSTQYLGADIYSVLTHAVAGQTIQLAHNGNYIASAEIFITVPNITLDLNGSNLALTSAGDSAIAVKAPNFTIGNGHITKALGTFVRTYSPGTVIHDIVSDTLTATAGVNQFLLADVGSLGTTITNVTTGVGQTVSFYFTTSNTHFKNVTCNGSKAEYCFRSEPPAQTLVSPMGTVMDGITCTQLWTKDCIGIRMGSATIMNSLIHGDIRAGQDAATGPGSNVPYLLITNTVFDRASQTPQIAIDRGDIATVSNCTFYRQDNHNAVAVDGQTTATLTNNTLHATVPGLTGMRLWSTIASPPPTVKETGTVSK
jgi:hypothetical protein